MKNPVTADSAFISEIFSSIQGEGPRMGERHLFIRFEECHIHCVYCDELDKKGRPYTVDQIMNRVAELDESYGPHQFVSLTGGEPLLYIPFLENLLPRLKQNNQKIYLETDGILWKNLERVMPWIDVIAMDMKPASVTGERNFFSEHRQFLSIAAAREVFIKIVMSDSLDAGEYWTLLNIVNEVAPMTPVFLQAVSLDEAHPGIGERVKLFTQQMSDLREESCLLLPDVRIGGRLHKLLNVQ